MNLFINIKYLRNFCLEVRIKTLQVIIKLMRAYISLFQYFGNDHFNNFIQAGITRSSTLFSDMLSQKGHNLKLIGVDHVFSLWVYQIKKPGLGLCSLFRFTYSTMQVAQ